MAFALGALIVACVMIPLGSSSPMESRDGSVQRPATRELEAFRSWLNGPIGYLLSQKERRVAEALSSLEHLDAFRRWFWERRDPSPGTPRNEFREAFGERIDFANKEFGDPRAGISGWRTARGVAYAVLGPPTAVVRTTGRAYNNLLDAEVEMWRYEFDDGPALEVPLIRVDGKFVVLETPGDSRSYARLDAALRRVSMAAIRNRDLAYTFTAPLAMTPVRAAWTASGSLHRTPEGLEGQISIPLSDLYGKPNGENLRVDLRFEVADARGATTALGELVLELTVEQFERWQDRSVTVAVSVSSHPISQTSKLVVTEVATGREVSIVADYPSDSVARAYAVEMVLGRAEGLPGGGAAFAFIAYRDAPFASEAVAWLVRPDDDPRGGTLADRGIGLRLFERRERRR